MAFDERLAERIRGSLGRRKGLSEKKMFGGIAFLLNGNMCVGVHKSELIVRLAPRRDGYRSSSASHAPLRSDWTTDEGMASGGAGWPQNRREAQQMGAGGCEIRWFTSREVTAPSNKRLKLAARVDYGMNLSSARRSLSAIR